MGIGVVASAVKVGLGIGVVALALLVCAAALAQTPTPDPPPVPQPPPPASEPAAPPPAEPPPTSPAHHSREHARVHREHAKERQLVQQELGPFHPSTAEAGPMVLVPQAGLVSTRQVLSAFSADTGSIAHTDSPRPVVIALAIVLVLMSGVLLLVFLQY